MRTPAIGIIRLDRPHARSQRCPIRNEADLVARYALVAQQKRLGVAADDDDRIQRAKHQRIRATYHLVPESMTARSRPAMHQHFGIKIVHDQHRSCALQSGRGGNRIGQRKRRGDGKHHVAALQFAQQRHEHAHRKSISAMRAPDQGGFCRHPVFDFDDGRLVRISGLIAARTPAFPKATRTGTSAARWSAIADMIAAVVL